MKTTSALLVGFGGMLVLSAALLAFGILVFMENGALREELDALRESRWQALAQAERERSDAESARKETHELRAKAAVRPTGADTALADVAAIKVEGARALRGVVYLEGTVLGEAWVVPPVASGGGGATGPARVSVVLDPASKVQWASRLEAESSRKGAAAPPVVTVENHYGYQPWGGYGWPVYWVVGGGENTNSPPGAGGSGRPPSSPDSGAPTRAGIWRPTAQPFLGARSSWPITTPQARSVSGPGPAVSGSVMRSAAGGAVANRAVSLTPANRGQR